MRSACRRRTGTADSASRAPSSSRRCRPAPDHGRRSTATDPRTPSVAAPAAPSRSRCARRILLHQLGRHRLAGLVVLGERLQRLRILHPLLEHLRRRLDEVVLGADAARSRPSAGGRRTCACSRWPNSWKNVSTSSISHEAGIAGLAAREVADQRRLGDLLARRRRCGCRTARRGCTCSGAGACRGRSGRSASTPSKTS